MWIVAVSASVVTGFGEGLQVQRNPAARGSSWTSASWTMTSARSRADRSDWSRSRSSRAIARSVSPATSCVSAARTETPPRVVLISSAASASAPALPGRQPLRVRRASRADRAASSMGGRDLGVRVGCREREVPGSLLASWERSMRDARAVLAVVTAPDARRSVEPSSGWVNRRRSPSSSRILARQGFGEAGFRIARPGRFHQGHGRIGERRDGLRHGECGCAERLRAVPAGARRRSDGIGSSSPGATDPPRLRRARGELEREERVAARRLPQPDQSRSWESQHRGGRAGARSVAPTLSSQTSTVCRRSSGIGAAKPGRHDRHAPRAERRPARRRGGASA